MENEKQKTKENWHIIAGRFVTDSDIEKCNKIGKSVEQWLKETDMDSHSDNENKHCGYSTLEYESLRDKALEMQHVLKRIDNEIHMCAMCGGEEKNGYSYEDCHAKICQILFGLEGYYKREL